MSSYFTASYQLSILSILFSMIRNESEDDDDDDNNQYIESLIEKYGSLIPYKLIEIPNGNSDLSSYSVLYLLYIIIFIIIL